MTDVLLDEPLAPAAHEADTTRFFRLRDVEWRDSGNGKEYTFFGMSTVFNSWSESLWTPRGTFKERFLPGAFTDILSHPKLDCRFLKNHNKDLVLARTKSRTLELEETEDGLSVWARVARTSYATDLKLSMERGDIDQMSIQFEMDYDLGADDRWYEDKATGEVCHDVIKVSNLYDVSVVTFPAYADTTAAMRDFTRAQERGRMPSHSSIAVPKALSPRAYQRCRQVIAETPWAIHPPYLNMIMSILDERSAGVRPTDAEIQERIGYKRSNSVSQAGTAAVIPLIGPIMSRAGAMSEMSGAKSLEDFKSEFRSALNDPEVSSIVLDIDSPGGTVDGVPEMAAEVRAARGIKPVIAVANYMAASAAYWIATAASELVVSPSAEVGSVGVYAAHQDRSAEMDKKGVKTTFIHAGENKVEANPFTPLSEEAQAYVQSQVDAIYVDFVGTVAKNRGVTQSFVLDNFGQGRMVAAKQAVELGMADRVATIDQVLQELDNPKARRDSAPVETLSTADETRYDVAVAMTTDSTHLETRDSVKAFLGLTVAQAETDPAGTSPVAQAETDPVGATDPLVALKAASKEAAQRARDDKVRLTKEMLK